MAESTRNGLKTLWEKEKLLVTSNFSFTHSVFKRLVLQTCKNQGLFGKGLSQVQKTESMSHRLQRFVVTFHCHLHHNFLEVYSQCLHVGVFHFRTAYGAPIGLRSFSFADVPFKFDELTLDLCPTREQFHHMNIFCHRSAVLRHFPHFHRSLPTEAFCTDACC